MNEIDEYTVGRHYITIHKRNYCQKKVSNAYLERINFLNCLFGNIVHLIDDMGMQNYIDSVVHGDSIEYITPYFACGTSFLFGRTMRKWYILIRSRKYNHAN